LTDTNGGSPAPRGVGQPAASAQALRSTRADRLDQAALLGDLDEHRRRDRPVLRMVPAQQGLGADQHAVAVRKIGW
jgi:hypothetical protein